MAKKKLPQRRYFTGLLQANAPFLPDDMEPLVHGAGWTIVLETPREERHRRGDQREIVILASKWQTAQKALDLILACHRLLLAEPAFVDAMWVDPEGGEESAELEGLVQRAWLATAHFTLACQLAAQASRDRNTTYAAMLFAQSQDLHANSIVELDPENPPRELDRPFRVIMFGSPTQS